MSSGWVHISSLHVPYLCFEIAENLNPCPNPIKTGKTRKLEFGSYGYPRVWILLPCLITTIFNNFYKVRNYLIDTCQSICDRAKTLLTSWTYAQEVKQKMNTNQATRPIEKWSKPSQDRYKYNIDVSFPNS